MVANNLLELKKGQPNQILVYTFVDNFMGWMSTFHCLKIKVKPNTSQCSRDVKYNQLIKVLKTISGSSVWGEKKLQSLVVMETNELIKFPGHNEQSITILNKYCTCTTRLDDLIKLIEAQQKSNSANIYYYLRIKWDIIIQISHIVLIQWHQISVHVIIINWHW